MKKNKGFTLIEMLIVVAIVAILVAIVIPVMNNQLEKSREAADAANIRSTYASLLVAVMQYDNSLGDGNPVMTVELKQQTDDWQSETVKTSIANLGTQDGKPQKNGFAKLEYDYATEKVIVHYVDDAGNSGPKSPTGKLWENCTTAAVKEIGSGFIYSSDLSGASEKEKELLNDIKNYLGWDEISIVYNENGGSKLVTCVQGDYSSWDNKNQTIIAYRFFYNKTTGEVNAVWEQSGTWNVNGAQGLGFWGGNQYKEIIYQKPSQ